MQKEYSKEKLKSYKEKEFSHDNLFHTVLGLFEVETEVYKKEIPTNFDGDFIKSKLEEIGKQRCKNSGQGFYRQVRDLKGNINSNISVKRLFNDNWQDVIIDLSNNDENIVKYLETNYK